MNHLPQPTERVAHATKRALGLIAVAALLRALFYGAVDAFAFHIFGDPRPRRTSESASLHDV